MAERQHPAEPTREIVKAMAATQSQCGSARPSVPSALPTREPRTWGIATAAPSAHSRSAPAARELLALAVDFDGDTQQVFHTGPGAVGVPGTARGLEAAHARFGSLPWAELAEPAIALARAGVELTPAQGYLHRILDGLLRHSPEG